MRNRLNFFFLPFPTSKIFELISLTSLQGGLNLTIADPQLEINTISITNDLP